MANKVTRNMGVNGDVLEGFVTVDTDEVFVPEGRFRELKKNQIESLAESIKARGQLQPILIDETGNLIDGNHRLHACMMLGIPVEAKIIREYDEDVLSLIEIDTNLKRVGLTPTELEHHLAERKRIYNKLYPDTAKRGAKGGESSGKKSFSEDTAETLGTSAKTVERLVKRGEEASAEVKEARDAKEISSSDMDAIIKETGADAEAQSAKLKDIIKAKAEKKEAKVNPEKKLEVIEEEEDKYDDELVVKYDELVVKYDELVAQLTKKEVALVKADKSVKTLQDRIAKAKIANPDLKI